MNLTQKKIRFSVISEDKSPSPRAVVVCPQFAFATGPFAWQYQLYAWAYAQAQLATARRPRRWPIEPNLN
jgi:hypothetical protein